MALAQVPEFGDLVVTLYWKVVQERPPIDFSITVKGVLAFGAMFIAVLAFIFFLGALSRLFAQYEIMETRIHHRMRELQELEKSVKDCEEKLREKRNKMSKDEHDKVDEELVKTKSNDDLNWRDEGSKLRHWHMIEDKYGKS